MKKRMYDFLVENNYIDRSIQKGFWPKTDGVTEHTELLTHIMKDAKRNGRSLTVVLLDLRNAFGEIQHDLIRSALKYHHLPSIFTDLFNEIYNGASITVAANGQNACRSTKVFSKATHVLRCSLTSASTL